LSFKPSPRRLFTDIADAIAMIEQFTCGMDFEAFRSNPMAVAAVERKLRIISEAAIRLGDEAERRCPDAMAGYPGDRKPASPCLRTN
jgi:uncharacterized protein with HEPN domain